MVITIPPGTIVGAVVGIVLSFVLSVGISIGGAIISLNGLGAVGGAFRWHDVLRNTRKNSLVLVPVCALIGTIVGLLF